MKWKIWIKCWDWHGESNSTILFRQPRVIDWAKSANHWRSTTSCAHLLDDMRYSIYICSHRLLGYNRTNYSKIIVSLCLCVCVCVSVCVRCSCSECIFVSVWRTSIRMTSHSQFFRPITSVFICTFRIHKNRIFRTFFFHSDHTEFASCQSTKPNNKCICAKYMCIHMYVFGIFSIFSVFGNITFYSHTIRFCLWDLFFFKCMGKNIIILFFIFIFSSSPSSSSSWAVLCVLFFPFRNIWETKVSHVNLYDNTVSLSALCSWQCHFILYALCLL